MKKLIPVIVVVVIVLIGIVIYFKVTDNNTSKTTNTKVSEEKNNNANIGEENTETMQIRISDENNTIIYELNNSSAAESLYNQLPLTTEVENYSSNEKIFYPTEELDTDDTPRASKGGRGILAYYEPWNDVVMFYDSFSSASGLYELGTAIEGSNQIENLRGEIRIEKN